MADEHNESHTPDPAADPALTDAIASVEASEVDGGEAPTDAVHTDADGDTDGEGSPSAASEPATEQNATPRDSVEAVGVLRRTSRRKAKLRRRLTQRPSGSRLRLHPKAMLPSKAKLRLKAT